MLEHFDPINIINYPNCSNLYVSKIELVHFNDHFDDMTYLNRESFSKKRNYSIPDYYYSKYDEGIFMDSESK